MSHICAIDGLSGLIPLRFCSAASCLDVSPAHTPCMSIGWYSKASLRHWGLTVQCAQMSLASRMYVMSLWCLGNIRCVRFLQAALVCHLVVCISCVGFGFGLFIFWVVFVGCLCGMAILCLGRILLRLLMLLVRVLWLVGGFVRVGCCVVRRVRMVRLSLWRMSLMRL